MHIVKRKGHKEEYDSRKVYASVYSACLTVRLHQGEAELIADKVSSEVTNWLSKKDYVTSEEIAEQVNEALEKYNPDAAYMYTTHRDLS